MEAVGQIVALIIAIFGVATYFVDKLISRRHRTIDKIGELLDDYHEKYADLDINSNFKEHVHFLSQIEQFCIAVDSNVYSIRIIRKFSSKFLCNLYHKYEDNVIAKRRTQFSPERYRYFEALVKKLERGGIQ